MSKTIPEAHLQEARALIENYGFDQDVLLGAIAGALLARDERAAKIADAHADGRRAQWKDMANSAKERRDFESMSIACVQVASAIRDRSKP